MDLLKNDSRWLRQIIYCIGLVSFLIESHYSYQGISNQLIGGALGVGFLSVFRVLSVFAFFVYGMAKIRPTWVRKLSSKRNVEGLPLVLIEKQRANIMEFSVFLLYNTQKIFLGYANNEEEAHKLAIAKFSIFWNQATAKTA